MFGKPYAELLCIVQRLKRYSSVEQRTQLYLVNSSFRLKTGSAHRPWRQSRWFCNMLFDLTFDQGKLSVVCHIPNYDTTLCIPRHMASLV